MIVILHKIAFKINSSLLGVLPYPIAKNLYTSIIISDCNSNLNRSINSSFIYNYLNHYKNSDWINS